MKIMRAVGLIVWETLAIQLVAQDAMQRIVQNPLLEEDREFGQSVYKDRLAGFMKYLADDAVFVFGDITTVGKGEIEKRLAKKFDDKDFSLGWEPLEAKVLPSIDFGYSTGKYTFYGFYARCRCGTSEGGNYVAVWKKESDGSWKITFLALSKTTGGKGCGCAS